MTDYNIIFRDSQRPLLIYGWGIHLAKAEREAILFSIKNGIPVICTWGAADLFEHGCFNYIGTFGTHGNRAANFALQNADVVLSIGSRLDTKATGTPASDFARNAKFYMVDIDQAEIDKFKKLGRKVISIREDAKEFLTREIHRTTHGVYRSEWLARIERWKQKYPAYDPNYQIGDGINPYQFIDKLSDFLSPEDVIVSDTGCPVGWMATTFKFKGQRFYHGWNNTPMGYGLPGAIGAAFAQDKRVVLITGDGGLGVNITEFATLARHSLNVKIILFNNRGHAMCRQTQRTWMGGAYPSTSYEGGLACPDFSAIARAYGIRTVGSVEELLADKLPGFLELSIHEDYQIVPQVKAGKPLEDAEPSIPREELAAIMK